MHRFALTGLLPVVLAVAIDAQTAPATETVVAPGTVVATEAELLAALDNAHPAVVAQAQAVAVARARVKAATTFENPTLSVVREDPSGPAEQFDWTLSWQLPQSSRRPEIAAQRQTVAAAEAQRVEALLALRRQVRQAYADWAIAFARHERLVAQTARVEALVRREKARAARGEASGLAAQRLALAAAGLRAQLALAAAATDAARANARIWKPDLPANAIPRLPDLAPPPNLEGDPAALRAAQASLNAATLAQRAAGRFVRSPALTVGWQRQETGAVSFDGPTFGLAWSLPVFRRNQAERTTADAHVAAAQARQETARREVGAGRTAALATYQHLQAAVAEAEATRAGNERMISGAAAAFRHGETSLTDLLDTLRAATESELTALDLYAAALAAHRQLETLAGPHGVSNSLFQLPQDQTPQEEPIP